MTIIYLIIFFAFIVTIIFLIHSIITKYNETTILNLVAEKIADGYLIFNINGKITNYNNAILEYLNLNSCDLKNNNIYNVFTNKIFKDEDLKKILDACKKVRETNEITRIDIKKDNKVFRIYIKSIVNNDIFLRYVIIFDDITNNYEIIENLKNNQEILANREKFATLGQLISRNC